MKRANNFKQNSRDWYAWRGKGLGASDAPAIMGVSPWTTRFELWAQKTDLLPRPDANQFVISAMERGKLLEPAVRAWYTAKTGITLESDVNCEHPSFEFMRCSLDGWAEDGIVREIKCPGKIDHLTAVKGKVPAKYFPQVQFQLLVTNAPVAEYISFDGENGVILRVPRDERYIISLTEETRAFWDLIQSNKMPEITPHDFDRLVKQIADLTAKEARYVRALGFLASSLEGSKLDGPTRKEPMARFVDGEEMEVM